MKNYPDLVRISHESQKDPWEMGNRKVFGQLMEILNDLDRRLSRLEEVYIQYGKEEWPPKQK